MPCGGRAGPPAFRQSFARVPSPSFELRTALRTASNSGAADASLPRSPFPAFLAFFSLSIYHQLALLLPVMRLLEGII